MAYGIYLPQRWRRQPPYFTGVDWSNPLSRQLVFLWAGNTLASGVARNSVLQATNNATSSATTPAGRGVQCVVNTRNLEWANLDVLTTSNGTGTGDFTMLVYANPSAAGSGAIEHGLASKNDAAGTPFSQAAMLFHAGAVATYTSGSVNFFTFSNPGTTEVVSANATTGRFHQWAGVRSGTTIRLYRDRDLLASTTGTAQQITQANRYIAVGGRGNGTTESFRGVAVYAYMFNCALSGAEISELNNNPWQLFRPATTPVIYSLPSGGTFTLALDAGSYSLTGQDPGLTSARSMALDAGAYNLTGNGVDFSVGRIIYLDAGSYSVTGNDPTLTSARSIALDAGAYNVTGNDVTLVYSAPGAFNLALDTGTYNLTGYDVTFSSALSFPLDTGVYTLSGLPVGLVWSGAPVVEVTDRIITLRSLTERWRM